MQKKQKPTSKCFRYSLLYIDYKQFHSVLINKLESICKKQEIRSDTAELNEILRAMKKKHNNQNKELSKHVGSIFDIAEEFVN